MATFDEISRAQYVLLTTFKKDGTPVGTAVWAALDGAELLVWTVATSWKVKRIRNGSHVTIAECDRRGNPKGDAVEAKAVLLDQAGTDRAKSLIASKYGVMGWLTIKISGLRRGPAGTIGISITSA